MRIPLSAPLLALLTTPALAAPPVIVTDTAITGSLVAQVMGDLGTPHVLLASGANAHSFQMRPSDAAALQAADLLVWFGPELTPWLARSANLRDGTGDLQLLHVPGLTLRDYGSGDAAAPQDHAHDDHDHDHAHDSEEDHGHAGLDPHAWLDPTNAAPWLDAIAASLSAIDHENAPRYAENAADAKARLATLDQALAGRLAALGGRRFVVFHDAYGYFTAHYGLAPAIPVALGDASSPSAARLTGIRQQVVDSAATCAFPEFGHDARLVGAAVEGTQARIGAALDPLGATAAPGASLYGTTLEGLATSLDDCLSSD